MRLLLLLLMMISLCCGRKQYLVCYSSPHSTSSSIETGAYLPSLYQYSTYHGSIHHCCISGIWIFYSNENYNLGSPNSPSWWVYGDNLCMDLPRYMGTTVSSIRFTGAPDDMNYSSINLYFEEYFIGDEEYSYDDQPFLKSDNRGVSLIVTGCIPWTLYQYDNYKGFHVCVFPANIVSCIPGFYTNKHSLGRLAADISSVRRGCHSREHWTPDNQ